MDWIATSDRDAFANTADADAYVPRTATESVLVGLEIALIDGARVMCLVGPAGSGKTLLLRVLAERVEGDFTSLQLPYSKLDCEEFCAWALAALGEPDAPDPERALADRIARRVAAGEPPIVWMIDDADLLPAATLRALLQLQRGSGDALRLLLVRPDALPIDDFAQAGVMPVTIELEGEMDRAEMVHYVRARLERAAADPEERAIIEAALDRLYATSRGNPGRLHAAAAALVCFGPDRLRAALEAEPLPAASPPRGPARTRVLDDDRADDRARLSIESLVAEAVASEPVDEVAIAEPPEDDPSPAGARRRHRLRRLGRR